MRSACKTKTFMRLFITLLLAGFVVSLSSCRKDFDFEPNSGNLRFSNDTVYLDTVFTNIGSSTYTLKVYNRSDRNISIPQIKLGKGLESKYRITVDGMTGNNNSIFDNVELLANDSMYVFIEVTTDVADANPDDFLYTDQIQFGVGTGMQTVELVTLIQDAVFLYPQRFDDGTTESIPLDEDEIYGFILDHGDHNDEYHFTNEKPYVIYGYAGVPSGETLLIDPGARVHFHESSGILIGQGGAIQANGDWSLTDAEENQIVFEGDRLEPGFSAIPGQWGTIWISPDAAASSFNHVTIKNAIIGLYVQNNPAGLTVKNTQIYDCSQYGIFGQTANITGENVVINNAGKATLACSYGGDYEFTHCTFNNNWPSSSQFAVTIDNYLEDADGTHFPMALTQADFRNCIIYGSNSRSFALVKDNSVAFNYKFDHCLIKFNNAELDGTPLYDFNNALGENRYPGIAKNKNPRFWDVNNNKLNIDETSEAIEVGDPAITALVPNDILNVTRTTHDAGAYQNAIEP
jgi:hypothetical protein